VSINTLQSSAPVQLSAIVVARDDALRASLTEELSISRRISHIVDARDSVALRHELSVYHHDLVVLLVEDMDERLPACLLRYPDLRVLVVVPRRKIGPLDLWLQQGANDVVSLSRPANLSHAFSRLVDECRLVTELNQAREKIDLQQRIHHSMLGSHPHAVMLRCGDTVLDANEQIQSLIGTDQATHNSQNFEQLNTHWERWLSPASRTTMAHLPHDKAATLNVTSHTGTNYKVNVQPIKFPHHLAQLISVDTTSISNFKSVETSKGNKNHQPARESLEQRLQTYLTASRSTNRYTAMLVQFPGLESTLANDGVQRTLQELSMSRANNALKSCFSDNTMLARASKSALLMVGPADDHTTRRTADQVHEALGSLGALTDGGSAIRISAVTITPESVSAGDVIKRLEGRARAA